VLAKSLLRHDYWATTVVILRRALLSG
jgi:hypothetical protein